MAMGANCSFELISIETYVLQFIGHNNYFLGSVYIVIADINIMYVALYKAF